MTHLDIAVDRTTVRLTHPGKVLYPGTGTTKHDVASYYLQVAPALIPWARDRPATRKRWVDGVGTDTEPGKSFFQKNLDAGTPGWVLRHTLHHKDHDNVYPLVNDARTLVWLAQISALEIHVPQWTFDGSGTPQRPDRLVLDLDPGEGVGLAGCAAVAILVREALGRLGLECLPVTSGSKGIHVYARLDGKPGSGEAAGLAHDVALSLEHDHPELVVSQMGRDVRRGKVFIDWSQNWQAKTTVVPYSLRGRSRPSVAAPRTWDEIVSRGLAQLDYRQVLERVTAGIVPVLPEAGRL